MEKLKSKKFFELNSKEMVGLVGGATSWRCTEETKNACGSDTRTDISDDSGKLKDSTVTPICA